jgi:hypothetical protein
MYGWGIGFRLVMPECPPGPIARKTQFFPVPQQSFRRFVWFFKNSSYLCTRNGGLAQLARALAWHARGHEFESRILHEGRNVRQTANKCLQFFCFRAKARIHAQMHPETKETAFAAVGLFRFFVRMPAAAKRSAEHREANSAYLSESLSRTAKTSLRSSQSFPPHKRHSHKSTSCGAKID